MVWRGGVVVVVVYGCGDVADEVGGGCGMVVVTETSVLFVVDVVGIAVVFPAVLAFIFPNHYIFILIFLRGVKTLS